MVRKLALALVAAVIALGGAVALVATAPSASAATTLTSCFKYRPGHAVANKPVQLMQWDGSRWVVIRNGSTNASGCATWTRVPSNVYVSSRVNFVAGDNAIGRATFFNDVTIWATPGSGTVNLGRITVPLRQCTWGYGAYCAGLDGYGY